MSDSLRINLAHESAATSKGAGDGGPCAAFAPEATRLARRIWEAFAREKMRTSNVALPKWEALDDGRRTEIISLSVEALGSVEMKGPGGRGPAGSGPVI